MLPVPVVEIRANNYATILAALIGACSVTASGVAYFEGTIPYTYADPIGIPTICVGHTGPDVTPGRLATSEECNTLLVKDLLITARGLASCLTRVPTWNQATAMISWAFNVGTGAACGSTLVRLFNGGATPATFCAQLDKWVWATKLGVKFRLNGLVRRRTAERAMCERGERGAAWRV